MVGLGYLPDTSYSWANAVSADGSVVVGYSNTNSSPNSSSEAFIWDATHGMRNLRDVLINDLGLGTSLTGWTLNVAFDISADGQTIVGRGTNPNGNLEAWIVAVVPEPCTLTLASTLMLVVLIFPRHRARK